MLDDGLYTVARIRRMEAAAASTGGDGAVANDSFAPPREKFHAAAL